MTKNFLTAAFCFGVIAAISSCNNSDSSTKTSKDSAMTNSSDKKDNRDVTEQKPISLFDGKSFAGWHGFNKSGNIPNWDIEDSAMVCLGAAKDAHGGDIVSDSEYTNFELSWEWKVSPGANSGVMYHVVENPKYKAPYETGPE